ncbi:phosphopantetheine-binding protein [Streptosporangium sp. NBC_01756]|uniref:phosphopantetheine-binding protein n=1 Tax=Streptosporangium sp. NBC_01756 TaxID=2975950 RepID=UPI002DD9A324|nr:phosphopantetheine-binding protein [Streptosporangium sp. NBC_01756]WSC85370.1 phosphopantetheine-binding protein [Streptosporangium sp. NBC_01756]
MTNENRTGLDQAEIERRVTGIWRDVLGARPDQNDVTFFELSGQSIAAVRITARVEDEVGVLVDIGELFEDPDLPAFVALVLAKAQPDGQEKLSA